MSDLGIAVAGAFGALAVVLLLAILAELRRGRVQDGARMERLCSAIERLPFDRCSEPPQRESIGFRPVPPPSTRAGDETICRKATP